MGIGYLSIEFADKIPSFCDIQKKFERQTGLTIYLSAKLHIKNLHNTSSGIFQELLLDAEKVANQESQFWGLKKQQRNELNTTTDWDERMAIQDKYYDDLERLCKMGNLNHIYEVQFVVPGFYEIDFTIGDTILEIETNYTQSYAVYSLCKVLFDLGGYWKGQANYKIYPEYWKKLKKWNEYRWYNRPKK